MVDLGLTAISTQFRSCRAFKVELYCKPVNKNRLNCIFRRRYALQ